MTWDLSVDDFMTLIIPYLEEQVDEMIAGQPIADRAAMISQRKQLVGQLFTATKIRNLEYRLAQAEARLRPRLVEES
jgi:hypothetical protein